MISETKYIKNTERITDLIISAMTEQHGKIPPENFRYGLVDSFFNGNTPKIYTKWYSSLSPAELNAVIVNLGDVNLQDITLQKQQATTIYNIDFAAIGTSDADAINKILYVSAIIRETLAKAESRYFEADSKTVQKFEISPEKVNESTDNLIFARLTFQIVTSEGFTDFNDADSARINDTEIRVNNGTYNLIKEW